MKEAILYEEDPIRGLVRCSVCPRRCSIPEGKCGYCRTRVNRRGKMYSLIYGRVASLAVSPIEKKPMFHFYPGSAWLSLGSLGCNFLCPGCQNWELAQAEAEKEAENYRFLPPQELVDLAVREGCLGISWTYNEPTVWLEYALEGAQMAKEKGLLTNFVTNGFISKKALAVIGPYLDSYRMDLKGFTKETYRTIANCEDFESIRRSAEQAKKKWGMHVEIVTNVIPGINDKEDDLRGIAGWIRSALGGEIPWHVTRFLPAFHWHHLPPTPIATLEKARQIGFEAGLKYVYLGNVPGHPGENTDCPECRKLLIRRSVFEILENHLISGRCPDCGFIIAGRF